MTAYDLAFYNKVTETARRSARHIVPIVFTFVQPRSVIDIGCGTGAWLSAFAENGVSDFLGVDGDFVPRDAVLLPAERFVPFDLTQAYRSDRGFDLVVSLEVAEHLPRDHAAAFVESLVRLGPAVLFSAAIPGQGGTEHINEQWQHYWADLFKQHDYAAVDCIRPRVWDNRDVAWWYAQNSFLYCDRSYALANAALARELEDRAKLPLDLVHPRKLDEAIWRERLAQAALQLARVIPPAGGFLLIDEGATGDSLDVCGRPIPFPQKNGIFAGSPADSATAIAEMRFLWGSAGHVVLVEPAFWWLSHYSDWHEWLAANSRLVLSTDFLKVFELRSSEQRRR